MTRPQIFSPLAACGFATISLSLASCENPFKQKEYLGRRIPPEQTHQIQTIRLPEQSTTQPVTVEQASSEMISRLAESRPAAAQVQVTLADVRAAALEKNLDLKVELFNPSISQADLDAELAKFEWAF